MAELKIWAPNAQTVQLCCNEQQLDMHRRESGWWHLTTDLIQHGSDYQLRVDDQGPFPDPRSPWQPQGIHGPSRWVDHSRYQWQHPNWQAPPLASGVVYELHLGTFTPEGTFESAIERLDYLVDLGITHVELMPVAEFSGKHGWGYDTVDLFAPHHAYGGPEGLKGLVDACHQRGLAVILDVIYNHLGPVGNYLSQFGPYFTDRYATPWGEAINFDGKHSDQVRRFFIDNALMWLRDYHIDGLRLDAVHAMLDSSAIHFLEQLATEVGQLQSALGRHLILIAESDLNDSRVIRSQEAGGYGIDAQWNEDFHHALHSALTGEQKGYYQDFTKLADLTKTLTRGFALDGCYSHYRGRVHGRSAADLPGGRFIGCLQNHDQVGNRAIGDRSSALLTPGQLKIGAALVLCSPFVPMLFQGEEWAASTPFLYFTDHEEPELADAVRNGRKSEFAAFGWDPDSIPDPQSKSTFVDSKLNWQELEHGEHRELLNWHRDLIKLRRQLSDLRDGQLAKVEAVCDEQERWLYLTRGSLSVVCNFAETAQNVPLPDAANKTLLMASADGVGPSNQGLAMPGHGVAILQMDQRR